MGNANRMITIWDKLSTPWQSTVPGWLKLEGQCNTQSSESESWTYGCSTWSLEEMLASCYPWSHMYIFLSHEAKASYFIFKIRAVISSGSWWGKLVTALGLTVLFQRTITAAGLMIPSPSRKWGQTEGLVINLQIPAGSTLQIINSYFSKLQYKAKFQIH